MPRSTHRLAILPCSSSKVRTVLAIVLVPWLSSVSGFSQSQTTIPVDTLKKLSMEELMNLEVISVSKRFEKLVEESETVPYCTALNVRLAWRLNANSVVSVTGQNLLHGRYAEYVIPQPNPRPEIERNVFIKISCRL